MLWLIVDAPWYAMVCVERNVGHHSDANNFPGMQYRSKQYCWMHGTIYLPHCWMVRYLPHCWMVPRAYRAAEGGERACNSRTSCIEGEMLAVTKFKPRNDAV